MSADATAELAALLARLSYRKGTFKLASGRESDFYVDVRQTVMTARGAALCGELIVDRLAAADVHSVGGMAVGAVPLVAAALTVADRRGYPLEGFFVRKQAKQHGTAQQIDGRFDPAVAHALVEDVVTTGGSTLAALDAVEGAGGRVATIVTVVDREEPPGIDALRARVADVSALVTRTRIVAAAG